jgi:hypothetical protein
MTKQEIFDWETRCTSLGLGADEVRIVSSRYDMYKTYTDAQPGSKSLPLAHWYKWYRVEKLNEGHGMIQPPPSDCSVSADGQANGPPVIGEADFLEILSLYRKDSA